MQRREFIKTTIIGTGDALRLTTDHGAIGWALSSNKIKGQLGPLQGKRVSELISPEKGMRQKRQMVSP